MTQATARRPLAEDVPDDALLKIEGATLSFGQVRALKGVTMHARRGEVTAIVGDNGAGKSTLIRCVSGVHVPDAGSIAFDGQAVHFRSPHDARDAGIETVTRTSLWSRTSRCGRTCSSTVRSSGVSARSRS